MAEKKRNEISEQKTWTAESIAIVRVSLSGARGLKTITEKLNRLRHHSVVISVSESAANMTGGGVGVARSMQWLDYGLVPRQRPDLLREPLSFPSNGCRALFSRELVVLCPAHSPAEASPAHRSDLGRVV
jgi:hypothetical protein